MSFTQFLRILRGRRKWVVLSILVGGALAFGLTALTPQQYTAHASLMVTIPSGNGGANAPVPVQLYGGYVATQLDLMTSQQVALRALKGLGAEDGGKERQRLEAALSSPVSSIIGPVRAAVSRLLHGSSAGQSGSNVDAADLLLADRLRRGLRTKNGNNSSVITVSFTSADPNISRDVVNAFVHAYLGTTLALNVGSARNSATWFNSQTKKLAQDLQNAQTDLSNYQQKHDIVATDDRLDTQMARLQELSSQLTAAQTKTYDLQSKQQEIHRFLRGGGASGLMPDVLASPMVQSLREKIAEQQSAIIDLRGKVGPNHPDYKSAVAELASLKRHLREEIRTVGRSISASLAAAKQREHALASAVAQQKRRVLSLRQGRDHLDVLKAKVKNAQDVYDEAMKSMSQARMASNSNNTDVSLVSAAVAPPRPSGPSMPANLFVGLTVGLIIGIGVALSLELQDRRVRCKEDLRDGLGIPVLAVIETGTESRTQTPRLRSARRLRLSVDG